MIPGAAKALLYLSSAIEADTTEQRMLSVTLLEDYLFQSRLNLTRILDDFFIETKLGEWSLVIEKENQTPFLSVLSACDKAKKIRKKVDHKKEV
ncbi:hypothetical protein [Chroococcidiopsis sp. CCNUC1]|uniref:hypothetical protein n=1 Tax=Chroococcidiopsis sp. CCNUC1 TaxID=2653189 RepID=UPI00201FF6F9|nr:hypothetical protein [Chroococcidiopsis sp. CCNUC1]URD50742.1 hypothetical protein M5J74_01855 [Chroococcidiopsis sp. CCNUC1]